MSTQKILNEGAHMVANRLRKNRKHLARWRKQNSIHCYRLYDVDLPEYAMAVDVYEGVDDGARWVHVQEYAAPRTIDEGKARQRLEDALAAVREVLEVGPGTLFVKVRRRQKGRDQYEKLAAAGRFHTFDVQRDHVDLLRQVLELLEPDGLLIFSNNNRRFKMDREALPDAVIEEVSRTTLPKDFERNPRIHNCWRIRPEHA